MDADRLVEQFNEVLESLFSRQTRHQPEKIATIAVYLVVSAASVIWAFSGGESTNALGAEFDVREIEEIDDQNFFLKNISSQDWTGVRVALNGKYLWKTDKIEAGKQKALRPEDFHYFFYVPRPWGRHDWEQLVEREKPAASAPDTVDVNVVQVRADQGSLKISKGSGGAAQPNTGAVESKGTDDP